MRRLLLPLAVAALLAGPASAASKGTIAVFAMRGPVTPVCAAEVPCNGPAPGVRITVRRHGLVIARGVTDARGRARLRVDRGLYLVTAALGPASRPRTQTVRVRVAPGRTSAVHLMFDTGIR